MISPNEGQRKLVAQGHSLAEVANMVGVSRPTVARWKGGEVLPKRSQRLAMQEELGIPYGDWEQPLAPGDVIPDIVGRKGGRPKKEITPGTPAPLSSQPELPPAPVSPINPTTIQSVRHSLACVRYDLQHRQYTASARSKVRTDETRTLALLAKLEAAEELREDRYVRNHPAWRTLRIQILKALEPFPDAAKAVLDAVGPG